MTRHELRDQVQHDAFTDTVGAVVRYSATNRTQIIRWAIAGLVVVLAVGAGIWYSNYARGLRQADLADAFATISAPVGQPNQFGKTFPTEDAKRSAALKALSVVIQKDAGSKEALIAQYYRGTLNAQQDAKSAESDLKAVAGSKSETAPLAKIALAQMYSGENRIPEAQALLRSMVDKPTDLVSKGQAQILLAQLDQTTNPQQAKKLLQSLQTPTQDPVVSRAAGQLASQATR